MEAINSENSSASEPASEAAIVEEAEKILEAVDGGSPSDPRKTSVPLAPTCDLTKTTG